MAGHLPCSTQTPFLCLSPCHTRGSSLLSTLLLVDICSALVTKTKQNLSFRLSAASLGILGDLLSVETCATLPASHARPGPAPLPALHLRSSCAACSPCTSRAGSPPSPSSQELLSPYALTLPGEHQIHSHQSQEHFQFYIH